MIDLSSYVQDVWNATTLEDKLASFKRMIDVSTAKDKTKKLTWISALKCSMTQLDFLASNYSLSGDGHKVI
jgi:hypothetical protein